LSDSEEPEDRRTEGVRIIGAQEAAEAAARPDVVQRRSRREKRYGDRPDEPEAASDLPKITISTTESDPQRDPDRFGAVPVVRPGGDGGAGSEPRWAEDVTDEPDPRAGFGHARIVEEEPAGIRSDEEGVATSITGDEDAPYERPADAGDHPAEPVSYEPVEPVSHEPEPAVDGPADGHSEVSGTEGEWADQFTGASSFSGLGRGNDDDERPWSAEPEQTEPADDRAYGDAVAGRPFDDEATQQWSAEDFAREEPAPPADSGDWWSGDSDTAGPDEEPGVAAEDPFTAEDDPFTAGSSSDPLEAMSEDDSFVLPHWTEPPTGQVPKVVVGDDIPETDSLATYGSQPRWRDEGERTGATDFDDLVEDGPRLGALGGDESPEEDFFGGGSYDDPRDDRYVADSDGESGDGLDDFDDFEDFDADDEELVAANPRRRTRRAAAPARSGGGAGNGSGNGSDRNLVTAVLVGVALVAVGLGAFALGAVATTVLATVIVTMAAWEYFSAVRTSGYNPATLLGLASVIGIMIAGYTSGLAAYPVVLVLSLMTGLLWYLWVAPGDRPVQNLGLTLLGILWIGMLGSFATLFLGLGRVIEDADATITSNLGIGVLLAAVVAAVSHDVGAYFSGRFFGRTPLSAASPNKTQEGLAGGVLTSLAVTVVVVGIVGIDPIGADLAQTFIFALLCAMAAPLGDLVESFVKRDLAIKDMGSVLPGHGGVLDRFDALLFVLPVAYFVTLLFDIWTTAT
jgi:phosphatidate cytidylyltransferase